MIVENLLMIRVILLTVLMFVLFGCDQQESSQEKIIRPITWEKVAVASFEQVRKISGVVQSAEETKLSFQLAGKVEQVFVNLGDKINKGDVLAQLDNRAYALNQQSSQVQLEKAQSQLVEAKNQFDRFEELAKNGLVSRAEYDSAKAKYQSASSAVDQAKTQKSIADKDLADSVLLAPYSGKITQRLIEPAMQLQIGQNAFEIAGQAGLEVQVLVPETLLANITYNKEFLIHFPFLVDAKAFGVVTEIGSKAQTANAFPVTLLINTPIKALRAGMSAEVDFTFEGVGQSGFSGEVARLPLSAVLSGEQQNNYVFIYEDKSKTVSKRKIQIENILNNEVLVSSGLSTGEVVATAGVHYLTDGQQVKLFNSKVKQFN
jgi:RND family efflux transporter MFP subunit